MANPIDTAPALNLLNAAGATSAAALWYGGKGTFAVAGTFAGATISLQTQLPDGNWLDIPSTPQSAAGFFNFEIGRCMVRAAVGSSSGTSVFATATPYSL